MEEYASRVRSYDDNCAFLEAHPELLHEHAMGYLLMEALQHGMDGRMVRECPHRMPRAETMLTRLLCLPRVSRMTCAGW